MLALMTPKARATQDAAEESWVKLFSDPRAKVLSTSADPAEIDGDQAKVHCRVRYVRPGEARTSTKTAFAFDSSATTVAGGSPSSSDRRVISRRIERRRAVAREVDRPDRCVKRRAFRELYEVLVTTLAIVGGRLLCEGNVFTECSPSLSGPLVSKSWRDGNNTSGVVAPLVNVTA